MSSFSYSVDTCLTSTSAERMYSPWLSLAHHFCLTTISIEFNVQQVMTKKPYLDFSPHCHFALSKGDILERLCLDEDDRDSIPPHSADWTFVQQRRFEARSVDVKRMYYALLPPLFMLKLFLKTVRCLWNTKIHNVPQG